VASGPYILPGFVHFDYSPFFWLVPAYPLLRFFLRPGHRKIVKHFREAQHQEILIRRDCRKPLPVPDGSVDHILCSHFLEHVYSTEAEAIIANFYRALKPNGTVHIILPNLETMVDHYNAARDDRAADALIHATLLTEEQPPTLLYRLMEAVGFQGLHHRWMYDYASMGRRLREAGFVLRDQNDTPSADVRRSDGAGSVHVVGAKPA
jgi:predicted SAM-dependent methyltransferase